MCRAQHHPRHALAAPVIFHWAEQKAQQIRNVSSPAALLLNFSLPCQLQRPVDERTCVHTCRNRTPFCAKLVQLLLHQLPTLIILRCYKRFLQLPDLLAYISGACILSIYQHSGIAALTSNTAWSCCRLQLLALESNKRLLINCERAVYWSHTG